MRANGERSDWPWRERGGAGAFDKHRPLLFSVAYRMLGSVMGGLLEACFGGDMEGLLALLSEDVALWSDGGGRTRAALKPIHGADKVARFFSGILRKAPPGFVVRRASINGRPGLIGYFGDGRPQSVTTFDVAEGSIRAIRLVVNPEKLRAVPPLSTPGKAREVGKWIQGES